MAYRLTLATPATRDLVVEALRARADTLTRAATRGAADVNADRAAGKDVRSRSVKLVGLLGDASELERIASELEAAPELALVEPIAAVTPAGDVVELRPTLAGAAAPTPAAPAPDLEARIAAGTATIDELADYAGLDPATLDDGSDDEEAEGLPSSDTAATVDAALGTP